MIWLDGNKYERLIASPAEGQMLEFRLRQTEVTKTDNNRSTGKLSATGMDFMIFDDDLNNGCHVSHDI